MRLSIVTTRLMAAVSLGVFAVPAYAQMSDEQPFSGFYVGGSIGKDVQSNDIGSNIGFDRNGDNNFNDAVVTATGANAFSTGFCNGAARDATSATGCINDIDGESYYGRVGFDKQYGPFVIGIVGEFGKSELTDSVSAFSTTPANYVMTREINWEASARLRGGYAVNTTLFYLTGGLGYVSVDNKFRSSQSVNAFAVSGDEEQLGFIAGGGIEQKIGQSFTVGLEYSYHDYKDKDFRVRVTQGTAPATNPFVLAPNTAGTTFKRSDDNFRWHSLRVTAGFRF